MYWLTDLVPSPIPESVVVSESTIVLDYGFECVRHALRGYEAGAVVVIDLDASDGSD